MSATRRSDYDRVLQAVRDSDLPQTVDEIAERAHVAAITVRRHLSRALDHGHVTRTPRRAPQPDPPHTTPGGRLPYEYAPRHSNG